jgi:hypothetical protein
MAKIITVDKDGTMFLDQFTEFLDIQNVEFYEFKVKPNGEILLTFYDKNREAVKLYERE